MNGSTAAAKTLEIVRFQLVHHGARAHTGVSAGWNCHETDRKIHVRL